METGLIVWLVVAVAAAIGEMLTAGLFLAPVALAAVLVAVAALVAPVVIQILLFGALSLAGIAVVRPIAVNLLGLDSIHQLPEMRDQAHIVGKRGIVTQTVDAGGGQIRIGSGEFWTARPYELNESIPVGAPVEVLLVENLTALVAPTVKPAALEPETDTTHTKGS